MKLIHIILLAALTLLFVACNAPATQPQTNQISGTDTVKLPPEPGTADNTGSVKSDMETRADSAVATLLKADDYDRAIEAARSALDAAPSNSLREKLADAYMARAWYYKARRLTTYTLNDLFSARDAAPDYYLVYYDLGRFYNNQMMQSTAVLELAKCIKLKPDFAPAYNEKSACESRIYRWEAALTDAAQAVKLNPDEALYYYTRSLAYSGLKKDKEAIADLEMAAKLSTDAALTEKITAGLKALGK